ncbi:chemotaxis protein CheW [Desulfuribacillus stibiiarsenatis]|uniref:Chemotaxis protein CheW n=1 Tax=Desulfuribacillus stibiiarsenatis TaxID=1390249 RepID=A0A1E5L735_9FIRM|nr:chemotaxis protein CheW [Desulfuribacillus stibiiarsenatis]
MGQEEYGIDIMLVQEIIRYERPTKVFNANPSIKGVMNFRGNVIPIIDMRKKFNLPKSEYDEHTVVIVIEVNQKTLGMIVDRVSDIISFPVKDIQYVDREFAEDMMTEHLKGMAKTGKRIIMLLDPLRVMSFEEYKQLKEVSLSSCNSVSEESDEE